MCVHGIRCITGEKLEKAFLSNRVSYGLEKSLRNSPGEAPENGTSSMAIQPPVQDISGGTHTQTHTQIHTQRIRVLLYKKTSHNLFTNGLIGLSSSNLVLVL